MASTARVGNPYASVVNPKTKTCLYTQWGRTGYRRSLTNYPWFADAKSGDIIVSEHDSHRLQIFDCVGNETRFEPFGSYGQGRHQFSYPGGVTTTSDPNASVICADTGNRRVVHFRITSDCHGYGLLEETQSFGQMTFQQPLGLELDVTRNFLVVCDAGTKRVTMHDLRTSQFVGELKPHPRYPLESPADVAIDDKSRMYVTDVDGRCVQVYDANGTFLFNIGEKGVGAGQFSKPWGLCFDRKSNLLVSDEGNNRVLMFTPDRSRQHWRPSVVTTDVYTPKGVTLNAHDNLVVTTGDPYNFLKILEYESPFCG